MHASLEEARPARHPAHYVGHPYFDELMATARRAVHVGAAQWRRTDRRPVARFSRSGSKTEPFDDGSRSGPNSRSASRRAFPRRLLQRGTASAGQCLCKEHWFADRVICRPYTGDHPAVARVHRRLRFRGAGTALSQQTDGVYREGWTRVCNFRRAGLAW